MARRPSNLPADGAGTVEKFVNTAYDTVKIVADNMDEVLFLAASPTFVGFLGSFASAPANGQDGQFYYDSTLNEVGYYDVDSGTWTYIDITTVINAYQSALASETAAQASEDEATAQANAALNSANNSASSASAANTSANQAAASASAASASETASASNATSTAADADSTAADVITTNTNASNTTASANAASSSAAASATSASASANSAAASSSSASDSADSAASALASKNASATSEANAATSEANASQSATDSQTSATASAGSAAAANQSALDADADATSIAADALSTSADATATAADRVQTGLDASATASDRTQTGLDAASTAADVVTADADVVATNADAAQTASDRINTAADAASTTADAASTSADAASTAADVITTNADAASTSADATQTAADRVQTGLDATATAADRVQTGSDASSTAADVVTTNADAASTSADATQTASDRTQTGLDAASTAADVVSTNANAASTAADATTTNTNAASTSADATQTAADRVQTGLDATATAADRVQTGSDANITTADATSTAADAASTSTDASNTAADRTQTGLDATATAADRVQTGLDAASTAADVVTTNSNATSTSADAASTSADATASASSAAAALSSQNAAAVSASSASSDAANASSDASSAASSASAASSYASEASTSETNAAASAASAASDATSTASDASSTSADVTAAANSASAAASSATAAATSESNASTSESQAASSESDAAASQAAALSSKNAAAASATIAANAASALTSGVIPSGPWDASGGAFPAQPSNLNLVHAYHVTVAGTMTTGGNAGQADLTVAVNDVLYSTVDTGIWYKIIGAAVDTFDPSQNQTITGEWEMTNANNVFHGDGAELDNIKPSVKNSGVNADGYRVVFSSNSSNSPSAQIYNQNNITLNPATGALTAGSFIGDGSALTSLPASLNTYIAGSNASGQYPIPFTSGSGGVGTLYSPDAAPTYEPSSGDMVVNGELTAPTVKGDAGAMTFKCENTTSGGTWSFTDDSTLHYFNFGSTLHTFYTNSASNFSELKLGNTGGQYRLKIGNDSIMDSNLSRTLTKGDWSFDSDVTVSGKIRKENSQSTFLIGNDGSGLPMLQSFNPAESGYVDATIVADTLTLSCDVDVTGTISGDGSNLTGLPVNSLTKVYGSSSNSDFRLVGASGTGNTNLNTQGGSTPTVTLNPATGAVTASSFIGDGSNLTNLPIPTDNAQLTNGANYLTTSGKAADSQLLDGLDGSYYFGRNYGSNSQDPDLAATQVILTNHANSPGFSKYWHITTTFYNDVLSTSNRGQVAVEYNPNAGSPARMFVRSLYSSSGWSPWSQLASTDQLPTNNNQLTNGANYLTVDGDGSQLTGISTTIANGEYLEGESSAGQSVSLIGVGTNNQVNVSPTYSTKLVSRYTFGTTGATFTRGLNMGGYSISNLGNLTSSSAGSSDIGTSGTPFDNVYGNKFYGDGSNLTGLPPTITDNAQLTNGAGYITSADGGDAATLDGSSKSAFATASQGNKADSALQTVPVATSSTVGGFLYDWDPSTGVLNLRTS